MAFVNFDQNLVNFDQNLAGSGVARGGGGGVHTLLGLLSGGGVDAPSRVNPKPQTHREVAQLKAQGPSRTCNESKEEDEKKGGQGFDSGWRGLLFGARFAPFYVYTNVYALLGLLSGGGGDAPPRVSPTRNPKPETRNPKPETQCTFL